MIGKCSRIAAVVAVLMPFAQGGEAQTGQRYSLQGSFLGMQHFDAADIGFEKGVELQVRYSPGKISIGVGVTYSSKSGVDQGRLTWCPGWDWELNALSTASCGDGGAQGLDSQLEANCSPRGGQPGQVMWSQQTWSDVTTCSMTEVGLFVEPRIVLDVGSDRVAPYLSLRLGLLRTTARVVAGQLANNDGIRVGPLDAEGSGTAQLGNFGGGLLINLGPVNLDVGATGGLILYKKDAGDSRRYGSEFEVLFRTGLAIGIG